MPVRAGKDQPWLPWNGEDTDGETVRPLQDVESLFNLHGVTTFRWSSIRPVGERISRQTLDRSPLEIMAAFDRLSKQMQRTVEETIIKSPMQQFLPFREDNTEDL